MLETEEYLKFLGDFPQTGAGHEYVRFLYERAMELKPKLILELGAGVAEKYGFISTRAFLLALKNLDRGLLISVDVKEIDHRRVEEEELKWRWIALSIDDIILIKFWSWGKIDLLYIDTSHTYIQTKYELELFSPFVSNRGVIILNDTRYHPEIGDAVKDFMREHEGEWTFLDHSCHDNAGKDYGMGVLRRIG